jgi:hypothetical protein
MATKQANKGTASKSSSSKENAGSQRKESGQGSAKKSMGKH